ncbi:succinate dehydrogenase [ubiquinone] flavoprotein subunit 1, mitochondrial-like isoform X2 [Brassica napus]|uniref:succinate dehydrogenase [ubiquinone] flavoprotein subunit 1, mitochondrial-like isoform X2 n=1 Tax=Brassica napus TaxID=3708 RepID=UPI000BBE2BE4|nr:succinate dehydrogenase [ubiquinone] flavoprotein subunit 1, mitochondrial-like isoform X2 [Brassica napus]
MERYAPTAKDLASRDVVSRSVTIEIREGRGVGSYLSPFESSSTRSSERKASRRQLQFLLVLMSPKSQFQSCPLFTTTWVVSQRRDAVVPGLMAAGEAACASVHGANRLGETLEENAGKKIIEWLNKLRHSSGSLPTSSIRLNMQLSSAPKKHWKKVVS